VAPTLAWVSFLACVAAAGAVVLVVGSVIGGQHAHGHWVQPARLIGVLSIALAIFGIGLLLTRPNRPQRERDLE
jgi:hypothetical protein